MDQDNLPPVISEITGAETKSVARWRWWLHLAVLASFPLVPGVMGLLRSGGKAILPDTVPGLIQTCGVELAFFAVTFAIAWLASRANREQMLLVWRRGLLPVVLGFAYSILLRLVIMILLVVAVAIWFLVAGKNPNSVGSLQPKVTELINPKALVNPLYLILCLTLLSFVVAALREELWRAGMLAGIKALYPGLFEAWLGRIGAVAMVAILFGLGHTTQGWTGVVMTGFLGLGLGFIMLWHRSIWEAVIAHGFFDASTFAAIYLIVKLLPGRVPGF